jgi:hypothetical protein
MTLIHPHHAHTHAPLQPLTHLHRRAPTHTHTHARRVFVLQERCCQCQWCYHLWFRIRAVSATDNVNNDDLDRVDHDDNKNHVHRHVINERDNYNNPSVQYVATSPFEYID